MTSASLRGTAQNDILKEYRAAAARGSFRWSPRSSSIGGHHRVLRPAACPSTARSACVATTSARAGRCPMKKWPTPFSSRRAYMDHVMASAASPSISSPVDLSFNFDIHGNFLEQIAKFRAGRRMVGPLASKRTTAPRDPRSMVLRMIAGGGGGGLTIEQPELNIVRTAYYALASALSGTQTMALCSYDEAFTIPTEKGGAHYAAHDADRDRGDGNL